jgi:ferredoxin
MSALVIKRIWIERSECLWHTLCVPEAPTLIENEPDGPAVVIQAALTYTQPELVQLVDASRVCPMRAFHIETEDGRVLCIPDDRSVGEALRAGNYRWSSAVAAPRSNAPVA